jgi:hypothetical protein
LHPVGAMLIFDLPWGLRTKVAQDKFRAGKDS